MLAAEGAQVALLARSADALAAVAGQIGPAARASASTSPTPRRLAGVFARSAERHGRVDVLVNNAGAGGAPQSARGALRRADLLAQMATNFLGPLYCIRAALPLMRAAGGGDVVNISSVAVLNPYPTMWLYSAAKAALELASAGLVDELRADGVRVSVLRSGSIDGTSFQEAGSRQSQASAPSSSRRRQGASASPAGSRSPPTYWRAGWSRSRRYRARRAGLVELRPS